MAKITVELNYQEIANVLSGLRALDGYDRIVKDGERELTHRERYKFAIGLQDSLLKNTLRLKARAKLVEEAMKEAREAAFGEKGKFDKDDPEKDDKLQALNKQLQRLMEEKQEMELLSFGIGELKRDDNPIAHTVLEWLTPLIDEYREGGTGDKDDENKDADAEPADRKAAAKADAATKAAGDKKLDDHMKSKANGKTSKRAPAEADA